MTSGQASLLAALFSLAQPSDTIPPPQYVQHGNNSPSNTAVPLASSDEQLNGMPTTHEDHDSENAVANDVYCQLALDRTVESNSLPFVLQSYSGWVSRMAFDPQKLAGIAQELVFNHFRDREQSRWIIVLLANIGGKIGIVDFVEERPIRMLSILQNVVRQRLRAANTNSGATSPELAKASDAALEAMVIHHFAGGTSEVATLTCEVAPIFRKLCPGPSDEPIDLLPLLHHPMDRLRRFVQMDIIFSIVADRPTMFRYEDHATGGGAANTIPEPIECC